MGLASVAVDLVSVHEKPSSDASRVGELLYGMTVQVVQQSDTGWCYVRSENHIEGYTLSESFQMDSNIAASWRKYKKVTVLAPYIDIQKQPDNNAGTITSVPRGGVLVALTAAGAEGWQKVGLVNGVVGFTRSSYLGEFITDWKTISEDDLRWNLVETALSYNGAAWRSGGRTLLGMDAVGLVTMTYLLNGVVLPPKMELPQNGPLFSIENKMMDEGDVIYFQDSMGIYVGENRFVHATNIPDNEGVVVSSLNPKDDDYREDLATQIVSIGSLF